MATAKFLTTDPEHPVLLVPFGPDDGGGPPEGAYLLMAGNDYLTDEHGQYLEAENI